MTGTKRDQGMNRLRPSASRSDPKLFRVDGKECCAGAVSSSQENIIKSQCPRRKGRIAGAGTREHKCSRSNVERSAEGPRVVIKWGRLPLPTRSFPLLVCMWGSLELEWRWNGNLTPRIWKNASVCVSLLFQNKTEDARQVPVGKL